MTFVPAARDIGEHWQDRQFIIVAPKNERIVPEKKKAKGDNDGSREQRAKDFRTRGARLGHLINKTFNAQRPTPNRRKCRGPSRTGISNFEIRRSVFGVRCFLFHSTTGFPSVMTRTLSSMP